MSDHIRGPINSMESQSLSQDYSFGTQNIRAAENNYHQAVPEQLTWSERPSPSCSLGYSSQEDDFRAGSSGDYITTDIPNHHPMYHNGSLQSMYEHNISNYYTQQPLYPWPSNSTSPAPNLNPALLSPRTTITQISHHHPDPNSCSHHKYQYEYSSDGSSGSPVKLESDASERSWEEGKKVVATPKIRRASRGRRIHAGSVICKLCGDDFTTAFARDRHMVSHTGRRDFPCTMMGCRQRFLTASGRKRHEMSPTLHKS
ncbi:hypothetical protein FIBSPDRAFT_904659 [Athelia psychrophila]|uniref:C2H2-type domain-containing protein n=1 Tax=Athelia psychrophila TaxID=1759441 RepID=A0A167UGG4_9AGAM|nr:hypothetical protein FIBSPDRAFT_904659 [Fibularhizoctonia sp. CBS 109695]